MGNWSEIQISLINWQKAWLVPFRFCVLTITLENIALNKSNKLVKFTFVDNKCTFWKTKEESITHPFYSSSYCVTSWKDFENFILCKTSHANSIKGKNVVTYFDYEDKNLGTIVNLFVLLGKFYIHKADCTFLFCFFGWNRLLSL